MLTRYTLPTLALLLALTAVPSRAQTESAVATVRQHFVQNQARYGTTAGDLSELAVTDAYTGRRTGATYVYLKQAYNGIEVFNAPAQAAVTRHGEVVAPHARFVTNLAARVNTTQPTLTAAAAADAAVAHLHRSTLRPLGTPVVADGPGEVVAAPGAPYPVDHFVPDLSKAKLVYFATEAGPIRLTWDFLVDLRGGAHLFSVRVDAETGAVLDVVDLTVSDTWGAPHTAGTAEVAVDLAPRAAELMAAPVAQSGSYNVFPMPLESPNHGAQSMTANPHNATASREGWHDTGSTAYTITRGNNAFAYEDRDSNDIAGFSPDGGAGLVFNYPFNPNQQPGDYQSLAITNLFYWNNIIHDVAYMYGFDEAAGNFQTNNWGLGGNGFDQVLAEAQDGAALATPNLDNANFSTPPDGGPGRMQMYEWSAIPEFEIDAPVSIAGTYPVGGAQFGVSATVSGEVVLARTAEGEISHACAGELIDNGSDIAGNIALIERGTPYGDPTAGDCFFQNKARAAQEAGAIGVIIFNCTPGQASCSTNSPGEGIITMALATGQTNDITIPAVFVQQSTGQAMIDNEPNTTATIRAQSRRDSDLDAGVIVHEYGHGIGKRLSGGPSNTACLTTLEQMGEGISDYFGLMVTQRPGDTATQPRGVGTYLVFEETDGVGIRPTPYSTDFSVNDATYGDTVPLIAGQQHTVGYIWATMVWEMTWELIGAHGYDADVYNADGSAGNQIALQLVMEGLKLQPCNPGFVDARDAILAADQMIYGGANYDYIWLAFARRGLGLNASQGSSNLNNDNVEDFTLPAGVANEPGAAQPAAYRLSRMYPNPFSGESQFTLEVNALQAVRVEVYDALGRRVALLHDGDLAAGIAHRFTVDARSLAAGTYLVRATGEDFAATERVTVLR